MLDTPKVYQEIRVLSSNVLQNSVGYVILTIKVSNFPPGSERGRNEDEDGK